MIKNQKQQGQQGLPIFQGLSREGAEYLQSHAFLAMGMVPETAKEDDRTVDCLFFSGADVARVDYWTGEPYTLRFDSKGADLSLLNNNAPVLDSHSTWEGCAGQIGKVERAWEDGGKYFATLRFSKRADPKCEGIWVDIRDGILTKFSMGVELVETVDERDKSGKLLTRMATKWRPFEISVVSVPADFSTTTLSAERGAPPIIDKSVLRRRVEIDVLRASRV